MTRPLLFLLGTHHPGWLATAAVPLMVSDRRLRRYRTLPVAKQPWALDSGGFTELARFGSWQQGPSPAEYVARIRRYQREIGQLLWAAPQDWMCEPAIVAKTGLSVAEHQRRTVANFVELRRLAPELPIIPVLQGWTTRDYRRCIDRYRAAGFDLTTMPLVGLGSVCRRQATADIETIIRAVRDKGVARLHGFGVKVLGLRRYGSLLTSADSMAWSYAARRAPPLPHCAGHASCANCPAFAIQWRRQVLKTSNERRIPKHGRSTKISSRRR